jgi:hypothetical protein
MIRLLGAALTLVFLAACASAPAPVQVRTYTPPPGPPQVTATVQGTFQPNAYLRSCGGIYVTNAPPMDSDFWVADYKPIIVVGQIVLATAPSNDVCLSSGFGFRSARRHDGIDLQSVPAGPVYSAAPGRILEARVSTGSPAMRRPSISTSRSSQGTTTIPEGPRGLIPATRSSSRPTIRAASRDTGGDPQ